MSHTIFKNTKPRAAALTQRHDNQATRHMCNIYIYTFIFYLPVKIKEADVPLMLRPHAGGFN